MIILNPVISIIVPSYNEEKNIGKCLDSILNQTFTDFEVICIDDNSTDSTFDIINEYSKKDSRIIPLKNDGKGVSSARNKGLKNSKGEYIGFVDSDDYIQPQMYEFLYTAVKDNNCSLAICNYLKSDKFEINNFSYSCKICPTRYFLCSKDNKFYDKNEFLFSSMCFKLVKKEMLKNVFFEEHKIGEDTVFSSNIWKNTENFCFVDLPLYCYTQNNKSITHRTENYDILYQIIYTIAKSYENLKAHNDTFISSFFLDKEIKYLLALNFETRKLKERKKYKKSIREMFKKYIIKYLRCKDIKLTEKSVIMIFYLFSPLYTIYRKSLDKTLQ